MDYEILDCIDAGTEFCPCHLAETGDCILCSQLQGNHFCDCKNWKGVCIYQEYVWNGYKAKPGRKTFECKIIKKVLLTNTLLMFHILGKHKLIENLVYPGSYIFLRNPKSNSYYDTPISIMEADTEENIIKVVISLKGTKSKMMNELKENDDILVRGPFWNGALGLKNICSCKDKKAIMISRGIGFAPMIPVMKKLYSNGNEVIVILDTANAENPLIYDYLDKYTSRIIKINTLNEDGSLSKVLTNKLNNLIDKENIELIHSAGPDILISNVINLIGDKVKHSCCNNAKMCCGEGVCGACCIVYKGDVIKRLCKVQIDPKYIFEGRRSL